MKVDAEKALPHVRAIVRHYGTKYAAAEFLGVNCAHVSRAIEEDHVSPTLYRALIRVGQFSHDIQRRRFAADVDEATQQRIARLRDATGLDNGGLLLAALDALEATAPADSPAASQSPAPAPPHLRRQSSCLPLR